MTPIDVSPWAGVEPGHRLSGGARNDVYAATRGSRRLVVRRSGRSPAALDWELDLLEFLAAHDIQVPHTVPADDGRRHVDGVVVQTYLDGARPMGADDWARVVEVLTRVHELTAGWVQRPGFASSRVLLERDRGGDIMLDTMPPIAVTAIRAAWPSAHIGGECVVHGDVGAGNILIDGDRVGLIDWDEARVDVPWFDFAFLPPHTEPPGPVSRRRLERAGVAWEAATCWKDEKVYSATRVTELVFGFRDI